ncbi:ABC transporter ATP-binding protein [Paenibacillus cellulositrophicus]|uniref:ABC transporter ATP-binding protein n=1 Tax=Paenibacillus TaxID=44249 RepID=UPI000E2793D6|nr:ABC transporter ATP-binding protein [Paenibacillus sp. VMFN-D1]RED39588.1 peptide/nickel transport system ATP-binding protein/oligopeptide transport system ATP-binding protein [Paenibacillus sp. VMFN-D1]
MSNLLEIDSLVTSFSTKKGMVDAVRGVTLRVKKGKTTVILGESGSGKSVMLRSILRLTQRGSNVAGSVRLEGEDLLGKSPKEMVAIRGNRVAMIFQDALSALDPLYRVGDQLKETIRAHHKVGRREAKDRVIELFRKVGIPSPEERVRAYPHEMSGGMRQRAVIAMALGCRPDLLLADEPTTALDVTIQAQILRLFKELQAEFGMSIVLVTHDIGVAAEMADEVAVMYAGKIVEYGSAEEVLTRPMHPYTAGLIAATPQSKQTGRLSTIPGQPPLITEMPPGCAFAQRCPNAESRCTESVPDYVRAGRSQQAACFQLAGRERYAQ